LFTVSLLGVIVTLAHSLVGDIDFSSGEILGIILMPFVVAAILIWYSKQAVRKGWIS
jgi:hypothetical protein